VSRQVSLRTFSTRAEAEIVQGLLASAGIVSWLATDDAGGAYPFQLSDGAHLMIDEGDYEEASRILAEIPGEGPGSSTRATGD
jgi:Putative prokaryotic signal transducing protein